ncbi:MAG: hypothetical protein M3Q10_11030 [Chloroflexota bacterium]|nr:hypothetical protein [Chloroflexota bacterium]
MTPGASSTRSPLFWANLAVKAALLALLLLAVVRPDLPQFEGKGMATRVLTYPLAALLVPVAWWIVGRRRGRAPAYPYAVDILLVLPFLIDTAGNTLDLYDRIEWWDDLNHLVNWGILIAAFGQFLLRLPVGRLPLAGLAVGFGAVTAILWELAEFVAFLRDSPERRTAYTDTLGDLSLGLTGSCLAAFLTAWLLWPRRHP